jgi:hypothetical protein
VRVNGTELGEDAALLRGTAAHEIDHGADALAALGCLAEAPVNLGNRARALGGGLFYLLFGEPMTKAHIHEAGTPWKNAYELRLRLSCKNIR